MRTQGVRLLDAMALLAAAVLVLFTLVAAIDGEWDVVLMDGVLAAALVGYGARGSDR